MILNTQIAGSSGHSVSVIPYAGDFGVSLSTSGRQLHLSDVAAGTTVYIGMFALDYINTDCIEVYNAETHQSISLSSVPGYSRLMSFSMPSADVCCRYESNHGYYVDTSNSSWAVLNQQGGNIYLDTTGVFPAGSIVAIANIESTDVYIESADYEVFCYSVGYNTRPRNWADVAPFDDYFAAVQDIYLGYFVMPDEDVVVYDSNPNA